MLDKTVIIEQMGAALKILQIKNPQKVLTLGGDCSVSAPVFSYLAFQNPTEEIGIIWIDAHPDITLPGDPYNGFHAMALAACLGKTDRDIDSLLPGKILPENVLGLGIRNYERPEVEKRFNEWSLTNIPVERLKSQSTTLENLSEPKNKKVLVHLDLDILEPTQFRIAVGHDADGMRIKQVVQCINEVSSHAEVIALSVAEPMPTRALELKRLLSELPLTSI